MSDLGLADLKQKYSSVICFFAMFLCICRFCTSTWKQTWRKLKFTNWTLCVYSFLFTFPLSLPWLFDQVQEVCYNIGIHQCQWSVESSCTENVRFTFCGKIGMISKFFGADTLTPSIYEHLVLFRKAIKFYSDRPSLSFAAF